MDLQQIIDDNQYNIRTQISLSSSLYQLLQEKAKKEQKSMAAIIRDNLLDHFQEEKSKEKNEREYLRKLAKAARNSSQKGKGWNSVKDPHKLIRKWRRDDDIERNRKISKALE